MGQKDKNFASEMEDLVTVSTTVNENALDTAIQFISSNMNPEDVFTDKDLEDWADRNGFIKE